MPESSVTLMNSNEIPALIEERGLKPLLEIHEEMGGWPVIKGDAWDEKSWSWQQSVKDFRKRGYSTDYIFDFSVGTDLKNSTRRIIDVSGCLPLLTE
jgi:membrane metallo-endopeptidase-like protein 1